MEFAKRQLQKYGWKEGEGLGKSKTGPSKAIKVSLKFDKGGLGHDVHDDLSNTWWKRLYDDAAKNIITKSDSDDSVRLHTVNDSLEITTRRKKLKVQSVKESGNDVYKNFIRTSELSHSVERKLNDGFEAEEKRFKSEPDICEISDEELFKICGGRTAHKGARHGLKMNAKLARLEKQESQCENLVSVAIRKHERKKKKKKVV